MSSRVDIAAMTTIASSGAHGRMSGGLGMTMTTITITTLFGVGTG